MERRLNRQTRIDFQPVFTKLVDYSIRALDNFTLIEIPESVSSVTFGKNRFKAQFYRSRVGEFRSVLITGPRVNIVNMFFFPNDDVDLPLYAMEFVVLGIKPIVAVIDIAAAEISYNNGRNYLNKAHSKFPEIQNGSDAPQWYQECRSGHDFFVRPENADVMRIMCTIHEALFSDFSELLQVTDIKTPENYLSSRTAWIRNYKDHHRVNSPGIPFLNRSLGSEWTDNFLSNYLFR